MKVFETAGLIGRAFGFEDASHRLRARSGGCGLGPRQTSSGDTERIPAQSDAVSQDREGYGEHRQQRQPANRRQRPEEGGRAHGNTFLSSSKCGPSRRVGQSPPQTMAVPCLAAAALNAAAMRG